MLISNRLATSDDYKVSMQLIQLMKFIQSVLIYVKNHYKL